MGVEKTIWCLLFWTEGRDPLVSQAKGETRWALKQTYQLLVCVLRQLHYFIKRVPATEEWYAPNLSDCIPTTHNCRRRRMKIWIILLYIYEFFVVCPAVQDATNWYKLHFHVTHFFQFPIKVEVLFLLFTFFHFYSVINRDHKVHSFVSYLCLLIIIRSGRRVEIRWYVWTLKSKRCLYIFFFRTGCFVVLIPWSNFSFMHNSQCITLPTQSCLVLYSFCANLLHSLIMWLLISSLSRHNLHHLLRLI